MDTDIASHEAWFAEFVQGYYRAEQGDPAPIVLKIDHSALVLQHVRRIIAAHGDAAASVGASCACTGIAGSSPDAILLHRAILLAALYHDVGRFPQYARWHTFKDSLSTNHGLLGVRTLKFHAALAAEPPVLRGLVLAAVALHNKFAVAPALSPAVQYVTHAVRDADKCDIIRIMVEEFAKTGPKNKAVVLHVQDDPALWTPKVVEDICAGRVAAYADLRSVNDFRMLLASWLYDLRFEVSKQYLRSTGYIEALLAPLPLDAPVQQTKAHLLGEWAAVKRGGDTGKLTSGGGDTYRGQAKRGGQRV